MASEPPDRTGYAVTLQGGGEVEISWQVSRESDGVGLGAFASQTAIDRAIADDRSAGALLLDLSTLRIAWPATQPE